MEEQHMKAANKWKILLTAFLLVLVMVFSVQNATQVEIRFLFWEVAFPRSLLIFLMLLIGMVVGWILRSVFRFTRNPH
jgi:uncharacterized integral membrane protein